MSNKIKLREAKNFPEYWIDSGQPYPDPPSESFFYRPYISDFQVMTILDLLERLRPRKCFEWGAGWSTIFFPRFVPEAKWISVEHRPFWIEILEPHLGANTLLIFREKFNGYVREPLNRVNDGLFDFVFVDGERREECIKMAFSILRKGGIVVKHDAPPKNEPIMLDGEDVRMLFEENDANSSLWWARK